ncbi:MAG TPA: Holliday junction resolvase RuvX [Chthoniobacterales bacterium]|jgi:putative Holliday junction resolvase|nr:Holliday junction resolvase RuvX [Chthoniobacterales bacterium]
MGIDYGRARIGIALSDELQMLAHPAETIVVARRADPVARVAAIVLEKNVERIVVGLPRHMNGSVGESANEANGFAEKLRAVVQCEVCTWDERLSTAAAHRALRAAGKSTRQTRDYVDQVAAQMILQSYLDRRQPNQGGAEPEPFA